MRKPVLYDFKGAVDASAEMLSAVAPPALIEYLVTADNDVLAAASAYAMPALMFDGVTDLIAWDQRFEVIVPPACKHARAWITRQGKDADGEAVQTSSTITTTTGGTAAAEVVTVPTQQVGAGAYLQYLHMVDPSMAPKPITTSSVELSGDKIDDAPAATTDRQLEVAEGLAPAIEEFRVYVAAGFGLMISDRSDDLEAI